MEAVRLQRSSKRREASPFLLVFFPRPFTLQPRGKNYRNDFIWGQYVRKPQSSKLCFSPTPSYSGPGGKIEPTPVAYIEIIFYTRRPLPTVVEEA